MFEESPRDTEFARRARSLLTIGANLQSWHEPEALEAEILKQLLEVTPADTAAIVRLAPNPLGEPLVRDISIFSDDVTMSGEFSGLSSLYRCRVDSVIVVPLVADGSPIGTLYLESVPAEHRLNRQHLEFAAVVGEYAGKSLHLAYRFKALKDDNRRLQSALQLEHNLIGGSLPMQQVSERIARIAQTDATVLIRGESGTGKELAPVTLAAGRHSPSGEPFCSTTQPQEQTPGDGRLDGGHPRSYDLMKAPHKGLRY